MKHLIVFPAFSILFIISLLFGGFMWLLKFSKEDFYKGSRFINTKLIRFTDWYNITK